ncbi:MULTISPECIES: LPXTG cell wall anchor domain-containing protein [Bifidobacterium]|uniref:LPXTG-domain and cell wall anchor domain-containing protein n=4 Tax=Bifidobacterium TaxID=1678 RepID=A0A087CM51_9BIFI|nr:LPXTG cell wall anchor domain-containing protein [Bifidobacterium psychraerophilum]KFI84351.1 LPXTG-domain and cell wall anchor domain-containing protein [Bifidobacterium psychraerophilum]PKA94207.1 adhesin isopeptide-forming family sspB-C2 type protein [Bifidobacterium psychraerophilum DSM 22366]
MRNWKKGATVAAAVFAALSTLVSPLAYADGGGGSGGGGTGSGGDGQISFTYRDSYGAPTLGNVDVALAAMGLTSYNDASHPADASANTALNSAVSECQSRYAAKHNGDTNAGCRLVSVGAVSTDGKYTGSTGGFTTSQWASAWNAVTQGKTYSYEGVGYQTTTPFSDGVTTINGLVAREAAKTPGIIVIVLSSDEPPVAYKLSVSTKQASAASMKVGSTAAVHDVITTSNNGSSLSENLTAKVIMHYDGQRNGYVAARSVTKSMAISNDGSKNSPDFMPSDFGLSHWQEGTYWFDVQVARQGKMQAAVDTTDREASESFSVAAVPPVKPSKSIEEGTSADRMVNRTTITTGTGRGGYEMTIQDRITPNGVNYSIDNCKLVDTTSGADVSGDFTITWDKSANTVTAVRTKAKGEMPLDHTYAFSFDVTVAKPDFSKVDDVASVKWNQEPSVNTDGKSFPTWRPNPDKSWIKYVDGKWQAVIDPSRSNQTGADTETFLDGDTVGSVVNGTVAANLIQAPKKLTLTDDWAKADYIFDAADASRIRVYAADASSEKQSSVADIANTGKDVTDQFTITVNGTVATATAKADYLASLKGLAKAQQLTLLIPGTVNFANGGGAEQVRSDFGKNAGDELTFCTNPPSDESPVTHSSLSTGTAGAGLTNAGSETVNTQSEDTNEPEICGYVPPVTKDVLAESSQGGDQSSVDGKTVFPGQKVEYKLETTPKLPANLAYQVTNVGVTDSYDQYLNVDKQTLEVTDLNTGNIIPKSQYTSTWDDSAHTVRLAFSDAWVKANWKAGSNPRIIVRFEGTVSADAPANTKVDNQWKLTLNNSITPSNIVENTPPDDNPSKQDTQKDAKINIDGMAAVLGDRIFYRVNLDASKLDNTAYVVQRLGMVDDYDEQYLKLDTTGIQVLDAQGSDVTGKFNIQEKDGIVYAFFKTVDTTIPATGETVLGDPQSSDLKAYSTEKLDPLTSPAIDQKVLGQTYKIVLPMTVKAVKDGYTVKNTAIQVTDNEQKLTNTVSNPLKEINPSKDVTVNVGGASADGQSIYLNHLFLYQLDSSTLHTNRAYKEITDWKITDGYDQSHDRYTGQWAVYATKDVVEYQDGKAVTLAAKGNRIAGSGVDSTKFGGDLFTAVDKDGVLTVTATARYLAIASSNDTTEQGWRAYVQMERTRTGDVRNQFIENLNGQDRPSNVVTTHTPDQTPSISIEKYDAKSGMKAGDRNTPAEALNVTGDTEIVFHITNTGKASLSKIDLKDATIAGSGTVVDLKYPANLNTLVLKPGASVDVTGTLKGIKSNDHHTDRAKVTAQPIIDCPAVDTDPFEGKTPTADPDKVCYDTAISAHDDWNGYNKPTAAKNALAKTGADIFWLAAVVVLLAGGGAGLFLYRRSLALSDASGKDTDSKE